MLMAHSLPAQTEAAMGCTKSIHSGAIHCPWSAGWPVALHGGDDGGQQDAVGSAAAGRLPANELRPFPWLLPSNVTDAPAFLAGVSQKTKPRGRREICVVRFISDLPKMRIRLL